MGYLAPILSRVWASMSQSPTISPWPPASLVSLSPLPPTPMQAKRTFSLAEREGALAKVGAPPPRTDPATPASAVCVRKSRRFMLLALHRNQVGGLPAHHVPDSRIFHVAGTPS